MTSTSNSIQHRRRPGVSLTSAPYLPSLEAPGSPSNSPTGEGHLPPHSPSAAAASLYGSTSLASHAPAAAAAHGADTSSIVTAPAGLPPQDHRHSGGDPQLQDRRPSGGGAAALLHNLPNGGTMDRRPSAGGGFHFASSHAGSQHLMAPLEPPVLRHARKASAMSSHTHGRLSAYQSTAVAEMHQVSVSHSRFASINATGARTRIANCLSQCSNEKFAAAECTVLYSSLQCFIHCS